MLDIPVLISGGGPVGLSASLFLSQHGVRSLLVERHPSTAITPKARGINARTMEVFRQSGIDAAVDCWGGNVVVDDPKLLNAKRPVAPIDLTEKMTCPLLGIFGNDDANPTADQVNRTEAVLKKLGKNYEFHRYDGAGHAFFNTLRDAYRPEQAIDGWRKVFDFFNRQLAASASSIAAE